VILCGFVYVIVVYGTEESVNFFLVVGVIIRIRKSCGISLLGVLFFFFF
jgi:hypothetical protein